MQGIVSLLDPLHTQKVKDLWAGLEARFGLRGAEQGFPLPHISYLILDEPDPGAAEAQVQALADRQRPFSVHTAGGLAFFTTPELVLYLPVVRSSPLDRLHRRLWRTFPPRSGSGGYYAPDQWQPHITLAIDDLTPAILPEVLIYLSGQEFHWEIRIDNLTFAVQEGQRYDIHCGCAFGKK